MITWRISSIQRHKVGLKTRPKPVIVLILLVLLTAVSAGLGLLCGSVEIDLAKAIGDLVSGSTSAEATILLHVRLPRMLGGLLAGAALATAGVIIQAMLGNPLAGPNIIGVNAGAGLAAVICCAALPTMTGIVPFAALIGAFGAMVLVYTIARKTGASRITLVLAGVTINSILGAASDSITTLVPDALMGANTFRMGSLAGVTLANLLAAVLLIAPAIVVTLLMSNELDVLALGDDTARTLGMSVRPARLLFMILAAALAGGAVSFCGLLGFVGLIVPHMARTLVGTESRYLLPTAGLLGASFLTLCDLITRILFAPFEFPVGIIMAFLGGPFFLWLLIRQKGGNKRV